jgi:lipopolysaccharide transport system ATP-binding protein
LTTDPLLAVAGVSKCYQRYGSPWQRLLGHFSVRQRARAETFWALQDVSFALYPGQTLGVIGRNGSGKSTLLQMISGTLQPTSGSVRRNGRIAALLELGAGFNPEFTGRENVFLNGAIYGLSRAQVQSRLDEILAFADIGDFIDEPVKHYSSGMFVRLAFAVIAHVDADILIIDEALAVGDALFASKCMRFLEGFRQRSAILFVSHDTGTVIRLCDEVL